MGKGEGKGEGQGSGDDNNNCLIGALLCFFGCWPCAIYWMCNNKIEGETAQ